MAKKAKGRSKGEGSLVLRGKIWFARWTVDGETFTRTTKESSKREAEKKLAEFTAPFRLENKAEVLEAVAVKIGGVQAEIDEWKDDQPAMTMLQAWGTFKVAPKGKTPRGRVIMPGARTMADYEGRWNAFCDWMGTTYPRKDKDDNLLPWELRQIEKGHAEKYIAEIGATKSANTRNKTLTFLRLFFKVLAEEARCKENPFASMDAAPSAVIRKRPLTMAELVTISTLLQGQGEMELLFSIGYHTGARLGDCVLLRWDSIDLGGRKIRYTPRKTAKGKKEITLTIAPALLGLLDAIPEAMRRGLVLPEFGAMYEKDPSAVSKRVKQVFTDAGIETDMDVAGYSRKVTRVGFHSLRHAHITALLENGVPMETVRLRAGHTTIGMTAHYFHDSERTLQATQDALPAFGSTATASKPENTTTSTLGDILAALTNLGAAELETVAARVRELVGEPCAHDRT